MLDKPALLQGVEGFEDGGLAAVVIEDFLAQALGMGMQEAGEDFFFKFFIGGGHDYL
jgi:hypothetical protein